MKPPHGLSASLISLQTILVFSSDSWKIAYSLLLTLVFTFIKYCGPNVKRLCNIHSGRNNRAIPGHSLRRQPS